MDFCNYKEYTALMEDNTGFSFILFGIKHSGKSTQGRLLADKLGCPFFDTDDMLTEQTGLSPRDLYLQKGPSGFMSAEESACRMLAEKYTGKRMVVSTGGGICDNAPALHHLRGMGTFVFLEVPEKTAADRIVRKITINEDKTMSGLPAYIAKKDPHTENDVRAIFHDFYIQRTELYRSFADISVALADAPKNSNFELILRAIGL